MSAPIDEGVIAILNEDWEQVGEDWDTLRDIVSQKTWDKDYSMEAYNSIYEQAKLLQSAVGMYVEHLENVVNE